MDSNQIRPLRKESSLMTPLIIPLVGRSLSIEFSILGGSGEATFMDKVLLMISRIAMSLKVISNTESM